MNVFHYLRDVKLGKVSVRDTIEGILKEAKKINKTHHYFNKISEDLAVKQAKVIDKNPKGRLAGLPVSVKDCICVKDVESTSGSKILSGYKPVKNATVVQRLIDEGAIIIGKTNQDEFGFGSFNVNVGLDKKIPKNPYDNNRVTGGSSGGAAGFTAMTKFPHVAISESTGGSINCPASFCGVIGFTPTYGVVSRYGLIDYANSLDKIGVMGKDIQDVKIVFDVINGHDPKDSTSVKEKLLKPKKNKKIGLIKGISVDKEVEDVFIQHTDKLKVKEISLPFTSKYGLAAYYTIAMAEASTNLAKFCGMRYGLELDLKEGYNDYFTKVRSEGFGAEAKRRIILGTFTRMAGYRDAYYLKAMKIRTLIIEEYKKAFKKFDLLISPTMPIIAPKFSDVKKLSPLKHYQIDMLTVGPNLAGLPHSSVNIGEAKGMPVGIQYISDYLQDGNVLMEEVD